jgi:uncharacterized RDD family membrane protein YckC/tRNA A-37 threonylcarbamoyl transferase component Bud32
VAAAPGAATAVLSQGPGAKIGSYKVEALIGRGGMGTVYKARNGKDSWVALKVLNPQLQDRPDFVSRFRREARAASRLEHPNIVRVLDYGVSEGAPYLAMELLEGQDLLALTQGSLLNEERAIHLMLQAAAGLNIATQRGIIHRDIKPTNLVVLKDDKLKIADFGLAKAADTDSHLTVTGEVLGTPHYMSPEQGRGAEVDFRSDLYSLGATFYHLLTGEPPFIADTPVAVIMKHLHEDPQPLRARAGHISEAFESIIHRLLQKDPKQRYQSYPALVQDLKRVLKGDGPRHGARPPARRVQEGKTTYFLPEEQHTELILQPAGLMRRSLATLLDLALLDLVLRAGLFCAFLLSGSSTDFLGATYPSDFQTQNGLVWAFFALVVAYLYFAVGDTSGGRTFGKSILRLRVCRRDGTDLGPIRSLIRTALVFPALTFLSPLLVSAFQPFALRLHFFLEAPQFAAAGLALIVTYFLLGRMANAGGPLHDGVVGARLYRAQLATRSLRPHPRGQRSASRAFWLSIVPGLGLMYAGRFGLGLLFTIAIPCATSFPEKRLTLGLWILSAVLAAGAARRRNRNNGSTEAPDEPAVRRKET